MIFRYFQSFWTFFWTQFQQNSHLEKIKFGRLCIWMQILEKSLKHIKLVRIRALVKFAYGFGIWGHECFIHVLAWTDSAGHRCSANSEKSICCCYAWQHIFSLPRAFTRWELVHAGVMRVLPQQQPAQTRRLHKNTARGWSCEIGVRRSIPRSCLRTYFVVVHNIGYL